MWDWCIDIGVDIALHGHLPKDNHLSLKLVTGFKLTCNYCVRVLVDVHDIVCECWWMYTILCASVGGCTRYCVRVLADVQYICGSTAVIQSDGKLTSWHHGANPLSRIWRSFTSSVNSHPARQFNWWRLCPGVAHFECRREHDCRDMCRSLLQSPTQIPG